MSSVYSKPIGWRGESYRHYLSSKGISSKMYYARDWLKGRGMSPAVAKATSKGWKTDVLLTRPDIAAQFEVAAGQPIGSIRAELLQKRTQKASLPDAPRMEYAEVERLQSPEAQVSIIPTMAESLQPDRLIAGEAPVQMPIVRQEEPLLSDAAPPDVTQDDFDTLDGSPNLFDVKDADADMAEREF